MGMNVYTFQVQWGDTDAAGIVFYPNFYKWMDQATHNLLANIGYPTSLLFRQQKMGVPLLEAKCQFSSPLFFEDQVKLVTSIAELRDKVIALQHEFYRDGTKVASGMEKRAWVAFSTDKPIKAVSIPDEIRSRLSQLQTAGQTTG